MLPRRLNRKEKLEAAWLNKLRDHIVSITPRGNSKNVMVNRASGGSTISLINQAKTASNKSSAYAGYFLCTLASTTTMTVASGECLINNSWFTVAEDTKTISESGYIYLNANYTAPVLDEYDNIVTAGSIDTPTIETSASLPTYSDSKFQVIIAEVTFAASAITDFIQEQHGMLLGFLFDDMSDNLNDDILDEIEQQQADQYCRTQSGCTYDISGSSRSSVDTIVTNMSDTEDSTTRDDYATGLDGGMWQESCGYYTARDNTTEDGVTYNARMYICGCNATEDDSVDELTDCAENNDDCFDEDCEEQTVMTSDTLGDETSCINAKNARSTPDGLGEICTTYDGEKTYWKACGKKDTTECTHAEVGGVDQ